MDVVSPETRILLELSMLKGVGPAALKKAAALKDLPSCGIEDFAGAIPQIERALAVDTAWIEAKERAADQIDKASEAGARILSAADGDYPRLLAETRDDPFLIYVKGKLTSTPMKSVAVIGTREPTAHGLVIAQRVTQFFVERGWSIVSGLALGCDAAAHEAALDAGGHTVAVLAHGLQMIAPSRHKDLARRILEAGGALVSEYAFGQQIQNQQYVKRDRTQAGMAQGVVMLQSDLKGGSLHASRAAIDYGRWLAIPYPTDRDRENREPKVQANLLLANGNDRDRAELLRCRPEELQRVLVLRSREDYQRMLTGEPLPVAGGAEQTLELFGREPQSSAPVVPLAAKPASILATAPEAAEPTAKTTSVLDEHGTDLHVLLSPDSIYHLDMLKALVSKWSHWETDDRFPILQARAELLERLFKDFSHPSSKKSSLNDAFTERRRLVFAEDILRQMHQLVRLIWTDTVGSEHQQTHAAYKHHTYTSANEGAHLGAICLLHLADTDIVSWNNETRLIVKIANSAVAKEAKEVAFQDILSSFDAFVDSGLNADPEKEVVNSTD